MYFLMIPFLILGLNAKIKNKKIYNKIFKTNILEISPKKSNHNSNHWGISNHVFHQRQSKQKASSFSKNK